MVLGDYSVSSLRWSVLGLAFPSAMLSGDDVVLLDFLSGYDQFQGIEPISWVRMPA